MKRTSVLLPDDVAQLVELESQRRGVTASQLIREAVGKYVAPQSRPHGVLSLAGKFKSAEGSADLDDLLSTLADHTARNSGLDPRRR